MADDVRKQLTPGTWFAGFHSPFFVTNEMVRSALTPFGLTDIEFFPRSTTPPVDPHKDPKYDDAWDTWLRATYSGPPKPVTVPHFDHVDWLLHVDAVAPSKPPPIATPAPATTVGPLLLLIALWALTR